LDPRTKGHVIQRMRNPKIAILLLLLVCVSFTIIEWLLIELPSSVMYSQKFVL